MKNIMAIVLTALFVLQVSTAGADRKEQKKGIKEMSEKELVELARSAAPANVSAEAAVMIPGKDGKLTEAAKGTNGFTCLPDLSGQEKPDPFCGDGPSMQWVTDFMAGKDSPSNTAPGIAYMAKGGWHWEKDGKIVMDAAGAKRVKEPPHWMIFWPFKHEATLLPTVPVEFGAYIMYEDTPYAHLMIYQDPMKMKK
ncbi:MAG: hypothetical protein Q8P48_03655 [Deltaproteobacteria bacterium]|nr:hypothetical protein [Deltaproteobacteria bacterium]